MENMSDSHVVVKLDFSNAFHYIRRDVVLQAVADTILGIYQYCHLAYQQNSVVNFCQQAICSQEGVQQGDPLGPLQFCLAVHPTLSSLTSSLNIGYVDDFTLGGPMPSVSTDVTIIRSKGSIIDLTLNSSHLKNRSHIPPPV
jgi:Reverse transcriptase (RNA-dependent DNA polymerase)